MLRFRVALLPSGPQEMLRAEASEQPAGWSAGELESQPCPSRLELCWMRYSPDRNESDIEYLEYLVDGVPLLRRLGWGDARLIGKLGWRHPRQDRRAVNRFLLQEEPELGNGRHMLYVCPDCADISCGALTGCVEKAGSFYVWRDFGYENDYEEGPRRAEFATVGPFWFPEQSYQHQFELLRRMLPRL